MGAMRQRIRQEIEGLRALAVLSVVLFHFGVAWLSGGFLGVDVFFVISGFLITRNIILEEGSGNFSLKDFYVRRFLRLFPSAAVTIFTTLVVSFIFLPPDEIIDLAQSAFAATFAVSNIYFWGEVGYFDVDAHLKPLLHTWSLGVEEQFYLIWPMALVTTVRLSGVKGAAWRICFLGALALVVSQLVSENSPSTAFYWMPFRIFEFAFGILVALPWYSRRLTGKWADLVGLIGLASVSASILFLRDSMPMPSVWSLFACAGTAAIIYVGDVRPVALLLSNRVMSFIGKISYSFYLVHWPVAVFMPLGNWRAKIGALVVCFVAAIAQFYMVEQPLRRGDKVNRLIGASASVCIAVSMVAAAFLASGYALYSDGLRFRLPPELQNIQSANDMWGERNPTVRVGKCFIMPEQTFEDFDQVECMGIKEGEKNILVVGDSFAADLYSALRQAYPDINFLEATSAACVPIVGNRKDANCEKLMRFVFDDFVGRGGLDAVVLMGSWDPYNISPGVQRTLDALAGKVKRVVLFGPPVRFSESAPALIFESRAVTLTAAEQFVFSHRHPSDVANKLLLERYSKVSETINLQELICLGRCHLFDGQGRLIFLDFGHLTKAGASYLAANIKAAHPQLF